MKKNIMLLLALSVFIGGVFAIGNSTGSEYVDSGRYVEDTIGSQQIDGGNVTTVNISSNTSTTKWAGFKGNLTGSLILSDTDVANAFYKWEWTPGANSVICASDKSNFVWGSVASISAAALETTLGGVYAIGLDKTTNTFTVDTGTITIGGNPITNTAMASVLNPTSQTLAVQNTDLAFCSNTLTNEEFAVLVPATTTKTYYFYVELN